ncbi:MAG: hypothetical protein GY847_39055 [Proteobacteria bacterium]|nr:hypothetical protein [Pseudomonadota bacterium]
MKNFKAGLLELILTTGPTNRLSWLGQIDSGDISDQVNGYLDELIVTLKGKKLEMSFASLDYMNSSAVPPIIKFIRKLDSNKIETEITYSKEIEWQASSFRALRVMSKAFTYITIIGR